MLYVALEGIDGSGKSEVARRVASALRAQGHRVGVLAYMGRGRSAIGMFIERHLFQVGGRSGLGRLLDRLPTVKLLLFQVNAFANWRAVVRAASQGASDQIVIGDRSVVSAGVIFPAPWRRRALTSTLLRVTTLTPTPTEIVYLDLAPEAALERICMRGVPLANESLTALSAAAQTYESVLAPGSWWFEFRTTIVDASRPIDDVVVDVLKRFRAFTED